MQALPQESLRPLVGLRMHTLQKTILPCELNIIALPSCRNIQERRQSRVLSPFEMEEVPVLG